MCTFSEIYFKLFMRQLHESSKSIIYFQVFSKHFINILRIYCLCPENYHYCVIVARPQKKKYYIFYHIYSSFLAFYMFKGPVPILIYFKFI